MYKICSARPHDVAGAAGVPAAGVVPRPAVPLRRLAGAGEEVVQGQPRDRLGRSSQPLHSTPLILKCGQNFRLSLNLFYKGL